MKYPVIYPRRNDVRWILIMFLGLFVAYAALSPGYSRQPEQIIAAVGTCVLLDFALHFALHRIVMVPISGFITSMGIILLTDSPTVWAYALVAFLSMTSKHFVQVGKHHIFNPNNFGLVVTLLFFEQYVTVVAGRWGGFDLLSVLIVLMGSFLVWKARRYTLVITYVLTFLVTGWIRAQIGGQPLLTALLPMTGPAFQLFIFYMITDPRTTPNSHKGQIVFGILVGVLDAYLRVQQNKYAPFLSLFVMTALFSLNKEFILAKKEHFPWKTGRLRNRD